MKQRVEKNEKGSTLVISLLFLTFALMAVGHLMTQTLQKHNSLDMVYQTHGDYEMAKQHAEMFLTAQPKIDMLIEQDQLIAKYKCLSPDEAKILIHAEHYLQEAQAHFKGGSFWISSGRIQSYAYSLPHTQKIYIDNRLYLNHSDNYMDWVKSIQKKLTNYKKVDATYQAIEDELELYHGGHEAGEPVHTSLEESIQQLKIELDKPYQFLLHTQVTRKLPNTQGADYASECVLYTLITYNLDDHMKLTYTAANSYTPRNPRSA